MSGQSAAGSPGCNPSFLAEWEAMSEAEYAASLRDIPDHILDSAPPDELPEEVWLALAEAEAAREPDPLTEPPGPGLGSCLSAVADDELGDGGLVDRVTGFERQASWAAAGQVRAVAELARRRVAARGEAELAVFVDELALALTCSRYAAWSRLHTALDLVDRLPATLAALRAGRICVARARAIAERLTAGFGVGVHRGPHRRGVIGRQQRPDPGHPMLARILPHRPRRTRILVRLVIPARVDRGHRGGDPGTQLTRGQPLRTGKHLLLDQGGELIGQRPAAGDERSADQRRADSLTGLATAYLDGTCPAEQPGAGTSPGTGQTQADTATPVGPASTGTAMGTDKPTGTDRATGTESSAEPAGAPLLGGYGPVPGEVALRLLAEAGWQRIVYVPLSGALLDVGTTVHDPPAALREHVLVRDGGCTQPVCGTARVDLDHNTPFPHGPTSVANPTRYAISQDE